MSVGGGARLEVGRWLQAKFLGMSDQKNDWALKKREER